MNNNIEPQKENVFLDNPTKTVIKYYNAQGEPIFKAKEILKTQNKVIIYPYYVNRRNDNITKPKIKKIEFNGWNNLEDLPNDFKKKYGQNTYYGIHSKPLKRILSFLTRKFNQFENLIITRNGRTRFSKKTITIKLDDLNEILNKVKKELNLNAKNEKNLINNELSKITNQVTKKPSNLYYGELAHFMSKYDSFEKIKDEDIDALSELISKLPKHKISVTSNFIKTKNKINTAFFEEILKEFKKLNSSPNDIEKSWQDFFEKNAWILSHLFPYDVILREREAYVGGKTIENKDGKVVDFLMQNGFKDNYALVEIKTHKKPLLKNNPYRGTDVFAMTDDLSGGINQVLDQKDNFIKDFGKELKPIDPKCILIIGKKSSLTENQRKSFELLRANQRSVDIVTFDELENKIKGLLNVINK